VVSYSYDAGGRLRGMHGLLRGVRYDYLAHQGYDEFGVPVRTVYGNGVESRRSYDPRSRLLAGLRTNVAGGREVQDLRYSHDRVGTLLALTNDVPLPRPSEMGGPSRQTFRHDELYQLVSAQGSYDSPPNKRTTYEVSLAYDETGNILRKTQSHAEVKPGGKAIPQKKTSYDWTYAYGGPQPHAATHIGDRTYSYDVNGNQTGWDHDRSGRRRTVTWTEEDRVRSVADNGRTTRFLYDASGDRTNKAGPGGETIYVNPWFSVRNGAIGSKHVWADAVRIASKVAQPSLNGTPEGPGPVEQKRYFYHPDHLGSAHFITDDDGEAYQHLEYFPFGEVWVAERSESQRTPYLYTGKELDGQTGLVYFGARYYDPRQSQWSSADPSFDRMLDTGALEEPDLSLAAFRRNGQPYVYAGNDPVDLVDPDGLTKMNAEARQKLTKRAAKRMKHRLGGIGNLKSAAARKILRRGLRRLVRDQEVLPARNSLAAIFRRPGMVDQVFFAISGRSNKTRYKGTVQLDESIPRTLTFTGGAMPRGNDTEIKVFETVLRQTLPATSGELIMLSERPECSSCGNAEGQFNGLRPNITTKVFDLGGPRPGNGL
jgi:RHS repeat-associated protein